MANSTEDMEQLLNMLKGTPYEQIVNNITLQQRLATAFDEQLKEPLRTVLTGRQMFAKQTVVGPEKQRVNFNKIREMGKAIGSRGLPTVGSALDQIKIDSTELDVVYFWKEYEIPKQDWQIFQAGGINLNAIGAISASYVTALEEDRVLLKGWNPSGNATTYDVEGMIEASTTSITGADFSTFGNMIKSVAAGWKALTSKKVVGCNMNLMLSPFNYDELDASISTIGVEEMAIVKRKLNRYPNMPQGTVLQAPVDQDGTSLVPDGYGIFAPVDPIGKYFDLVIGANYINDVFQDGFSSMFSPMAGMVVTSFVPRFIYPEAIGVINSLGSS